jgi:hypothetical protein
MKHEARLKRLEQEHKPERPVYKIEWCTAARAAELEAQRPPAWPGEIRYIVEMRGQHAQPQDQA